MAELEASRLRLQEEQRACAELGTTCALQLGELACKTTWLESVTLVNVTLKSRLSAKIEEINELEAERDDWQQQASQLQREREEFQAEQAKQQQECLKLQKELRSAQLGELKSQQQLRIAQMTAKQAQCEQERLQMKLNAVEADTDVTTCKENLLPQLNVPFTPKLHDVGRLATPRSTKCSLYS
ncbi:hypothetical protein PHYBOEH_007982 [Phytophthora boehmeriae]|uniref:Uncharacterized protein n=1 Tax=Phytophthora boehmeriae TaxID=109152 RepID=A0A8T1W4H4_9STRA|nr:hypothetical protein PHYBOEH_007982 [Phytophthora boehmeriae]